MSDTGNKEEEADLMDEFWTAYDAYVERLGKFIDTDKRILNAGEDREKDRAWLGRDVSRQVAGEMLHASGMACFMGGLDKYLEAAAKDRESQEKNRKTQNAQTFAMVFLTFVIAVSTALYTVAAWKTVPQPERRSAAIQIQAAPPTAPADPQSPPLPKRDP